MHIYDKQNATTYAKETVEIYFAQKVFKRMQTYQKYCRKGYASICQNQNPCQVATKNMSARVETLIIQQMAFSTGMCEHFCHLGSCSINLALKNEKHPLLPNSVDSVKVVISFPSPIYLMVSAGSCSQCTFAMSWNEYGRKRCSNA